jgi:hypothetical protein
LDIGLGAGQQLAGFAFTKLMEELEIAEYLQEEPCQRTLAPYSRAEGGWDIGE